MRASLQKSDIDNAEMALSKEQIAFIEKNVPQILLWERFWTVPLDSQDPVYDENIGRTVPVKLISLKGAVIVFIPWLRHTAITYVKLPGGQLDYSGFSGWPEMSQKDIVDGPIKTLPASSGWSTFLSLIKSSEGTDLNLTKEQKEIYLDLEKSAMQYSQLDAQIRLLPSASPAYAPDDDDKQILLERIIEEALEYSEKLFEGGKMVNITVPNFNVGDSRIWVLIEDGDKNGVIVNIQMTTNPRRNPVAFSGIVLYDIKVERYGVETGTVRKIRQQAVKVVRHTIKGSLKYNHRTMFTTRNRTQTTATM